MKATAVTQPQKEQKTKGRKNLPLGLSGSEYWSNSVKGETKTAHLEKLALKIQLSENFPLLNKCAVNNV